MLAQGCNADGQDERLRAIGLRAGQEGAWCSALSGQVARPLIRPRRHEHEPQCQLPLLWEQAFTAPTQGK